MPAIYEHLHTVHDGEIDILGHVNNLEYIKWMLAAAVAHSREQGWPSERYRETGGTWVVRRHAIEYLQSAYAGDEIFVRTWIADFKRITSLRRYEIFRRRDDAKLVVAETNWAFVSWEKGIPCRIPPELASAFEIVPDTE